MAALTDEELLADLLERREKKNDYDGDEYTENLRAIAALEKELARRARLRQERATPPPPMTAEISRAIYEQEKERGWSTE